MQTDSEATRGHGKIWVPLLLLALSMTSVQAQQGPQRIQDLRSKEGEARQALTSGDYSRAIPLYLELTIALPEYPGLRMNLGLAYYMIGRTKESITHLERVVSEDSSLTLARLYLGSAYLRVGEAEKAVSHLQIYVRSAADDPQGRQTLGDAYLALRRYSEAAGQFEALSRLAAEDPAAWFGIVRSYEGLAEESFNRLDQIAPESAFLLSLVAQSKAAAGHWPSAFFLFRKALEKKPDLRGLHLELAQVYQQSGHPEWAEIEKSKEAGLGPPDCAREKLVCLALAGTPEQVIREAASASDAESLYWISQAYNQLAGTAFGRLAALPPSIWLHEFRAEMHKAAGSHLEAAREWRKAVELSPQDERYRSELALALVLSRDYETAQPLVQQLLQQSPTSPLYNYLAGDILLNQQKVEQAVPLLMKSLEFDPEYLAAHKSLGRAYVNLGEHRKAIPSLEKTLAIDADGSSHFQLARAYQSVGERDLARQTMLKYQEIQRAVRSRQVDMKDQAEITPP